MGRDAGPVTDEISVDLEAVVGRRGDADVRFPLPLDDFAEREGEVLFKFKPTNRVRRENVKCYYVGDRIGQMVIMPIYDFDFREAEELDETDRGTGGYGSSGA